MYNIVLLQQTIGVKKNYAKYMQDKTNLCDSLQKNLFSSVFNCYQTKQVYCIS